MLWLQVGELPLTGNGTPQAGQAELSLQELSDQRMALNLKILSHLREDGNASTLRSSCAEDASKGRMTAAKVASEQILRDVNASPRFGVLQGA